MFGRRGSRPFTVSEMQRPVSRREGRTVVRRGRGPSCAAIALCRTMRALGLFVILIACVSAVGAAADEGKHLGVATCASSLCHGSARPLTARSVTAERIRHLVALRPARARLPACCAKRRARRSRAASASRMHTKRPNASPATPTPRRPSNRGERFQSSDGIGCEACHGGSEHWLATHDDAPERHSRRQPRARLARARAARGSRAGVRGLPRR